MSDNGQWYSMLSRPWVMNHLATIIGNDAKSLDALKFKNRYYNKAYSSKKWYEMEGEIAILVNQILQDENNER